MTQIIVLDKLVAFLQLQQKKYFEQLSDEEKNSAKYKREYQYWEDCIARLDEQVDKGHCFGLAVVHAVKNKGEMLDWWEQVLVDIANWDETEESLNHIKSLSMLPKQMGSMTGSEIFTYAVNAIVSSHVEGGMSFILPDLKQNKLLQSNSHTIQIPASIEHPTTQPAMETKKSFLEVGTKTIKQHKVIAGNFTKEQLMEDLNEELLKDLIILVHNSDHAIRIGYNECWIVYNSEYDHTKKTINENSQKESIYRTFVDRSECIEEIFRIQQNAVAIEVASFEEKPVIDFPAFNRRVLEDPLALMSGEGLARMTSYRPDILEKILQRLSLQVIAGAKDAKLFVRAIAKILIQVNNTQYIARNSEVTLLEVLKCVNNSKEGYELLPAITQALPVKAAEGYTVFHLMAYCSPTALLELFKLVNHPRGGRALYAAITATLTQQTQSGHTPLHLMLMSRSATELLAALLNKINSSPDGIKLRTAFTTALNMRDANGATPLNYIALKTPQYLSKVKQIMAGESKPNNSVPVSQVGHFRRQPARQQHTPAARKPRSSSNR